MLSNAFAPEYPRNSDELILFPRDSDYRKELFPLLKLDEHPAKANIYLVQAIVEFVSEPEETITVTPEILAILDKEIDWCSH